MIEITPERLKAYAQAQAAEPGCTDGMCIGCRLTRMVHASSEVVAASRGIALRSLLDIPDPLDPMATLDSITAAIVEGFALGLCCAVEMSEADDLEKLAKA